MQFILISIGLICIIIYWIKRISRTTKNNDKIFGGATINEAVYQWIGWILVIIGIII